MSVLVLIEHDNKVVKASSLNTITAAKKIDQKAKPISSKSEISMSLINIKKDRQNQVLFFNKIGL